MGAYPTACYRYYDYDPDYLKQYRDLAGDADRHDEYLQRFVHHVPDHSAFLKLQPADQLARIRADDRTGYAKGLER